MTASPSKHHSGLNTPQGKNTWKKDLEMETWTAGFRFSCRKIETAARDRAG